MLTWLVGLGKRGERDGLAAELRERRRGNQSGVQDYSSTICLLNADGSRGLSRGLGWAWGGGGGPSWQSPEQGNPGRSHIRVLRPPSALRDPQQTFTKQLTLAFPRYSGYHPLALGEDDTIQVPLVCVPHAPLLVYAFHGGYSICVSLFKANLALSICNPPVPEKVRQCSRIHPPGQREDGAGTGAPAGAARSPDVLSDCTLLSVENTQCHRGALVPLSFCLQVPSNWTLLRMTSFSGNVLWEMLNVYDFGRERLHCPRQDVSEAAVSGAQQWKCHTRLPS